MPWMVSAPSISAITALAGMPSVSVGMNLHWASALFADSGPATPSIAPLPKREGSFAIFFSIMYEENEAIAGPVPGSTPRNAPMPVPLTIGQKDAFRSALVGMRPVTLLVNTARFSVSPRFSTISPIANTPTAMTMKPMPSVSSGMPKL